MAPAAEGHIVGPFPHDLLIELYVPRIRARVAIDRDRRQPCFEWCQRPVVVCRHSEVEPEILLAEIRAGLQTALQNAHAIHTEAELVEPGGAQNFRITDSEVL